jgi:hypothetical protein
MTLDDLTVSFGTLNQTEILSDWLWLTHSKYLPILLTASGDAFLQNVDDESVHCLDTGEGKIEKVAASVSEFEHLLKNKDFVVRYLGVEMVGDLIQSGKELQEGQIYSLIKPYILGGEYSLENIEATDIEVHFSVLGQVHCKVKDLPEGTDIGSIEIK